MNWCVDQRVAFLFLVPFTACKKESNPGKSGPTVYVSGYGQNGPMSVSEVMTNSFNPGMPLPFLFLSLTARPILPGVKTAFPNTGRMNPANSGPQPRPSPHPSTSQTI